MKVLVTGAAGFLGSHIVAQLLEAGHNVLPVPQGRKDFSLALAEALGRKPDAVVHAAGPNSVHASIAEPLADFRDSVALTAEVLDGVRRFAPRCGVLFLSSAAVYGDPPQLPANEGTPVAPLSPYGHHKWLAEEEGRAYLRWHQIPFCVLRIFSAYGPGLRRQVIFDVASGLCRAQVEGGPLVLRGTGEETRDFVHGEDVAQAVQCALDSARWEGEAYNVASGEATRICDLVGLLQLELHATGVPIIFDGVIRSGDVRQWQADIMRLRSLDFRPRWTLPDGVADLVHRLVPEFQGSKPVRMVPNAPSPLY